MMNSMNVKNVGTTLIFKTKDASVYIDNAMLAAFPQAEWNEVQSRSTFKSESLFSAIADALFENAADVKSKVNHLFDVMSENEVVLNIDSADEPQFRQQSADEIFADAQFALADIQQFVVVE
jgi:hypothetical protein